MKKESRKDGAKPVEEVFYSMIGDIEPEKGSSKNPRKLASKNSLKKENKKSRTLGNKKSCKTPQKEPDKKSRAVTHDGLEYKPANLMLRTEFRRQIKHYAADQGLLEYQVIDLALEEFFKSIKS